MQGSYIAQNQIIDLGKIILFQFDFTELEFCLS